jgi:hypothetical protein
MVRTIYITWSRALHITLLKRTLNVFLDPSFSYNRAFLQY